jgi:DNA-binding NtrC family response regulator
VRELRALVYDAMSRHRGGPLTAASFPDAARALGLAEAGNPAGGLLAAGEPVVFPEGFPTLRRMTDFLIESALKRSGGNQARAARLLGISPQALNRRLKTSRG